MTEPKKFTRGKHSYTHWGPNFKEVRVYHERKAEDPAPVETMSVDIDDIVAMGVYSNSTLVHLSGEEVVLDFVCQMPGRPRGRVRSRVIVPLAQVGKLAELLTKTSEQIKKMGKNQ